MMAPTAQQATPPQGIQQVLPGQAAPMEMNQMLQQQQAPANAAGVASFVKPLSAMDPALLQRELANPTSQYPKFAVLAALDSKNKQLKAQQAMQQQLAMQQAQAQGQGTVADQIVAESGQLQGAYAHGGEVQKFQAGGSTAFDDLFLATRPDRQVGAVGGETYEEREKRLALEKELAAAEEARQRPLARLLQAISPESKLRRSMYPSREELLAAREGRAPQKAATVATPQFDLSGSPAENISALVGALRANPNMPAEERNAIARRISTLSANLPRGETGAEEQPPRREPLPDTGVARFAPSTGGITQVLPRTAPPTDTTAMDEVRARENAQQALITAGAQKSEAEQAQQQNVYALRKKQFEEAQATTAAARAEAERRLQEAKSRPGIFSDPEALAGLAGAISTRKGELMGSAARGLAGLQSERRKALEAAQEKYGLSQEKFRAMQALDNGLQLALEEKKLADMSGDRERQQRANMDVAALQSAGAKFRAEMGLKEREVGVKERALDVEMRGQDIRERVAQIEAAARAGDQKAAQLLNAMNRDNELQGYRKQFESALTPSQQATALAGIRRRTAELERAYGMPSTSESAESAAPAQNDPLNIRNP